jgi:putative toxin-antitoxin system antitoxin component (TIGR02293 family)
MNVRIDFIDRSGDATERRVASMTTLATKVFGSAEKASRWLRRPRRDFAGVSPLEMLETKAAARQVETLLRQLDETDEGH